MGFGHTKKIKKILKLKGIDFFCTQIFNIPVLKRQQLQIFKLIAFRNPSSFSFELQQKGKKDAFSQILPVSIVLNCVFRTCLYRVFFSNQKALNNFRVELEKKIKRHELFFKRVILKQGFVNSFLFCNYSQIVLELFEEKNKSLDLKRNYKITMLFYHPESRVALESDCVVFYPFNQP